MDKSWKATPMRAVMLVVLRLSIGWHFLYEGVVKLWNPDWSARSYLLDSKGPFAEMFYALTHNQGVLNAVDFLNIWGLILVGLGLLLGFLTRIASIGGIVLLAFYYLSHPPLITTDYLIPSEGSYLLVNKTLIELFALWVLYLFPTGTIAGIDRFIFKNQID